jgi:4-hydroxy-tetrahydrodipicolinate synthase
MTTLIRMALNGNFADAQAAHYEMLSMFEMLSVEGNPPGIKAALRILGYSDNVLRLPLTPTSQKTYDKIEELILGMLR